MLKGKKMKEVLKALGVFSVAGMLFLAFGCEQEPAWEEPAEPVVPEEEEPAEPVEPEEDDLPDPDDLDF